MSLGETDEAERQIERGIDARSPAALRLKVDPAFDRLRSSVAFERLVRRVPAPTRGALGPSSGPVPPIRAEPRPY